MNLLVQHDADLDTCDEVRFIIHYLRTHNKACSYCTYYSLTQRDVMVFEVAEQRDLLDLARKLNPQQVN